MTNKLFACPCFEGSALTNPPKLPRFVERLSRLRRQLHNGHDDSNLFRWNQPTIREHPSARTPWVGAQRGQAATESLGSVVDDRQPGRGRLLHGLQAIRTVTARWGVRDASYGRVQRTCPPFVALNGCGSVRPGGAEDSDLTSPRWFRPWAPWVPVAILAHSNVWGSSRESLFRS